jgi:predicted MPP superfamily phosphohydrolase
MVYFLLIVIAIDLLRLLNHFLPLLPTALCQNMPQVNFIAGIVVTGIVAIVLIFGRWNATHPQIRRVEITLPKAAATDSLRIAFASDIHLGSIVGQRQLRQLVETINDLQPDVIFSAVIFWMKTDAGHSS